MLFAGEITFLSVGKLAKADKYLSPTSAAATCAPASAPSPSLSSSSVSAGDMTSGAPVRSTVRRSPRPASKSSTSASARGRRAGARGRRERERDELAVVAAAPLRNSFVRWSALSYVCVSVGHQFPSFAGRRTSSMTDFQSAGVPATLEYNEKPYTKNEDAHLNLLIMALLAIVDYVKRIVDYGPPPKG